MYKVNLSSEAEKDLNAIDKKIKPKIISALLNLRNNPFAGKKLSGRLRNCYSLRVWPYRIIYLLDKKELLVLVIRIGQRGGVYK